MKIDASFPMEYVLPSAGRFAGDAEHAGYDGVWCAEVANDPVLPELPPAC